MRHYSLARGAWHLLPESLRTAVRGYPLVQRLKERAIRHATHDELYDGAYYETLDRAAEQSAPFIVASIVRDLHPSTVLDVGCGSGAILAECARHGIVGRGLEYSDAGLAKCHARGLAVAKFDLETTTLCRPHAPYDVVLSTEVAEHLPERLADAFVDALVSQGRTIVFTAATPGQGGVDHVNEQPHAYWIAKFAERGYTFDAGLSQHWRAEWLGRARRWYANNAMVFRGARPHPLES